MSSSGSASIGGNSPTFPPKDYYNAGSAETVTETKLTVSRLETVSPKKECSLSISWDKRGLSHSSSFLDSVAN
eukprot:scaffold34666_cov158-Amphora_coffeaeformis.AAC.3